MSETTIIGRCFGLNNRLHPTQLSTNKGQFLSSAVNVDITDDYGIARRPGHTALVSSLTNGHSLAPFMDRYAIFADGTVLYCFDTQAAESALSTIQTGITKDAPLSWAQIGDASWWANGRERGAICYTAGTVENTAWPELRQTLSDNEREIAEFPMVDLIHYFSGSLYGAARGDIYIYVSIPYRPSTIDAVAGHLAVPAGVNWISNVNAGLLVGTDDGIFSFVGNGLSQFVQRRIHHKRSFLCSSGKVSALFDGNRVTGILTLCDDGIYLVTDDMTVIEMTRSIAFDWRSVSSGAFGLYNNSYIFSGVTND